MKDTRSRSEAVLARVDEHYAGKPAGKPAGRLDARLTDRLRDAFQAAGCDVERLSLDEIAGIDQLHLGGRAASRRLSQLAQLPPGSRVLDIGCGTGGASRLLAAEGDCQVVGIDVTAEFIDVARWLSRATGLSSRTRFICADAAELPLPSASVDAVWCQHALLNMPTPDAVIGEWCRVLAGQGKLLLHEVVSGDNPSPLVLPVPWASRREHSQLESLAQLERRLESAGFECLTLEDVTADALAWRGKHARHEQPPQADTTQGTPAKTEGSRHTLPGAAAIFGESFVDMGRNLLDNLQHDRVRVVQGVWQRG